MLFPWPRHLPFWAVQVRTYLDLPPHFVLFFFNLLSVVLSFLPSPGPVLCSPFFPSLFLRRVRFVSRRFFSQLPASCFLGLGGIVFLILVFCFFVLLIVPICNRQLCISYRFLPPVLLRIPPLYSVHHGRSCSSVQYLSQASNVQ